MRADKHFLTRRRFSGLVVSAPLALRPGFARARRQKDYKQELETIVSEISLPQKGAELDLVSFELRQGRGRVQMQAVIGMTWPPGRRTRGFKAEATDPDWTLIILAAKVEVYFISVS